MTETHCPYCSLQCGMRLSGRRVPEVSAWEEFPVNQGALCRKGWSAAGLYGSRERLTSPLVRDRATGEWSAVSWDDALDRVAAGIRAAQAARRPGRGRGLRRRRAHQREGLLAREVRPRRARHLADRLQRPLVHVVGRVGRHPRLRARPRAAVPARRRRGDRRAGARRVQPRRDDAARRSAPRPAARTRRSRRRHRPASYADRGPRRPRAPAGAGDRPRPGARGAAPAGRRGCGGRGLPGRADDRLGRRPGVRRRLVARAGRAGDGDRGGGGAGARGDAGRVAEGHGPHRPRRRAALHRLRHRPRLDQRRPRARHGRQARARATAASPARATARAGASTGRRPTSCPATAASTTPPPAPTWRGSGESSPTRCPAPGGRRTSSSTRCGTDTGPSAMLVLGSNIVVSAPNATHVTSRLESLDLLVVCDFVMSETAAIADVVLPVTQWAEETGTMTNLEGRVVLRQKAITPPSGVRSDLDVIADLAARLGSPVPFATEPEEVFAELGRASAGGPADYSAITYDRIRDEGGVFWGGERLFALVVQPSRRPRPDVRRRAPRRGRAAVRRLPGPPDDRAGARAVPVRRPDPTGARTAGRRALRRGAPAAGRAARHRLR